MSPYEPRWEQFPTFQPREKALYQYLYAQSRPDRNPPGLVVSYFEDDAAFTVTGTGAAKAADTTNFRTGTQSVKLTTGAGEVAELLSGPVSLDMSSLLAMDLSFYVHDYAKLARMDVYAATVSDYSKYFARWVAKPTYDWCAGWNTIHLVQSDFAGTGAPSWDEPIVRWKIRITPVEGQVAEVSFDGAHAVVSRQPVILLMFDDGYDDVYDTAYPLLAAHGAHATFYIITNQVGTGGHATTAELTALQAAGWTIANHTSDHTDLTTLSQAEAQTKIATAYSWLAANGFSDGKAHVAYPYGTYNDTVFAAMAAESMLTGRTVFGQTHALPWDHVYRLAGLKPVANTDSLATIEGYVDAAISGGLTQSLLFHHIVDTPSQSTEWATADLESLLSYIAAAGVPCLTIDEWYGLSTAIGSTTLLSP